MIKADVKTNHLTQHPNEFDIISPLIGSFDINWARSRNAYNTIVSCYIVDPKPFIKETFGFSSEIALFISPFDRIQPRTLQAIFQFLHEDPIRGRVDRSLFLLILPPGQSKKEVYALYSQLYEGRIPVLIDKGDLGLSKTDGWGLRNLIAGQLYTRDLFDYQLPLRDDYGFFGRESLVFDFSEAISKGQNRGLFGLRKTGKTSLLFKIVRNVELKGNVKAIYYDCKKPLIRKLQSADFINKICDDVLTSLGRENSFAKNVDAYERIELLFSTISDRSKICLIFDEIEYISYFSQTDRHWGSEFVDFWQTLWSVQSETGKLALVLGGVNAKVVEDDLIDGVQNPLFGIVPSTYLQGLDLDETRKMLRLFGKRMGLNFDEDAIAYINKQYGGHPLLTRKACSYINSYFESIRTARPIQITASIIKGHIKNINEEVKYYFKHILSEIQKFYDDEYEILEMMCSGQKLDAMELVKGGYQVAHLKSYGLITTETSGLTKFTIECLENYIAFETARREGRRIPHREVGGGSSEVWLHARLKAIARDASALSRVAEKEHGYPIFPGNELCKPDQFFDIRDVRNEADWTSFLLRMYQSLVECVERAGKGANKKNFFYEQFKDDFPFLQEAVQRIRAYRNASAHALLNPQAEESLAYYLEKDFGRRDYRLDSVSDMRIAQQHALSEIMIAIQHESSRKSP